MNRNPFRALMKRLGPRPIDPRHLQAAGATYLTLGELLTRSREENEAIIRGLCFNAYLGNATALCRVLGRYKILVDTEDMGVSVHLMSDGFWEIWHTEAMLRLLKPGMKAVDIGANLGYFSLLMSEIVGPSGSVHAFEPNPAIAARLRTTLAMNGFEDRAVVHGHALGDRSGSARLLVPVATPGGAHVLHDDSQLDGVDIRIDRFDAIPDLADADYVKIDVEGAEHAVWRGMTGVLAKGRPLIMVVEFTAARYDDPSGFVDAVLAAGFSLALLDERDGIVAIDRAALLARPAELELLLVLRR